MKSVSGLVLLAAHMSLHKDCCRPLCTPALLGLLCLQESVVPRVGLLAYAVGMPLAFTPGRPFGSLGPAPAGGAAVVDDFLHSVMSHPCLVICATQQTT